MAAAVVASNLTPPVLEAENGDRSRLMEYEDPVLARTLTVDESFRKMEELVGSEEETKNWKGIVISLVVIVFILSMIALSIALITPGKDEVDPGAPFTLSLLTDPSLQPKTPIFHFSPDGRSYITVRGSGDKREVVEVDLKKAGNSQTSPRVLLPSSLFITELQNLQDVALSPDRNYLLVQIQSESEVEPKPSYRVYNISSKRFVQDSDFQDKVSLDLAMWIGVGSEMLYLKDNTLMYKAAPDVNPETIATEPPDNDKIIGIPNKLYTDVLGTEPLIWLSPDSSKVVFAKVTTSKEANRLLPSFLTLHLVDFGSIEKDTALNFNSINSTRSYLLGVSWLTSDQLVVAWLDAEQKTATYMMCDVVTYICSQNLEYSNDDLRWVDVYQMPLLSPSGTDLYTILPDPANRERYYHHLVRFKLNKKLRTEPQMVFLSENSWSDHKIVGIIEDSILYTSAGTNYTQRHLYRYNTTTNTSFCLTCQADIGTQCLYVDATLASLGKWVMLSCLGPDLPSHYIVSTEDLKGGKLSTEHELGASQRKAIREARKNVKYPNIEHIKVPLDSGYDAHIKCYLPPEMDRNKTRLYGLVIVIQDGFKRQVATQQYPKSLITYLGKNQSLIVVEADLRGSTGRGDAIEQAVYGGLGLKESHDITQIITYIETSSDFKKKVDRSKMAVMGIGYGGFVALHSMLKGLVPCAVAVSPITDLNSLSLFSKQRYMGNDRSDLLATELKYDCKPGEDCTAPRQQDILLLHGTSDDVVHYNNSLSLMRKLQLAGYEFKQQTYPGVGHDLGSSSIQNHYYLTITSYLTQCFNKTSDIHK